MTNDPTAVPGDATATDDEAGDRTEERTGGTPILAVKDLSTHYPITEGLLRHETGHVRAVDGVSFAIDRGEAFGLVGESGCGKTTVARTVVGLETPTSGRVAFEGRDVTTLSEAEHTRYLRRVQLVFQDPTASFDPRMTIGEAIAEPMRAHGLADRGRRNDRIERLLSVVGLAPEDADRHPHELSGGEKQRAALARALALDPDLLVLDEPVSALDVSIQAEIIALVADLREAFDLSVLLISHDISVVRQISDRVGVMYAGQIVERGATTRVFDDPRHPYTEALLGAVPHPDPYDRDELGSLSGDVPDPSSFPSGCRFHPRCPSVVIPDGTDLSEDVWRRVFDLRTDLRGGEVAVDDGPATSSGTTATPDTAALRDRYDLPDSLADESADRELSEALAAAIDGSPETAAERLSGTFSSVCDRDDPVLRECDDRLVACHHYETGDD